MAAPTPSPVAERIAETVTSLGEKALSNFRAFNFLAMEREQWTYVGYYYGLRVAFVLVLMTLAWTLSGWASAILRRGLNRVKFDETLTRFLSRLVRWLILVLVALTCLSYFGVETTSFAAVIGAAGLAIGLAFQGTLSNFAAGAMLLIFRPYKVGDEVIVAGHQGIVFEIELFTTEIDTADNRRVIIPNSSIFGSVIENISHHAMRRTAVDVGVGYGADIDETRKALERAVRGVPLIVADPAPAAVLLGLGASSVDWQVRGWARKDSLGAAREAIIRAVKQELDGAKIEIPFPQMDVHLTGLAGEGRAA